MNAKSPEENTTETAEVQEAETAQKCGSGACKPHTSLYLSVVAILLAAYAAISAGKSPSVPTDAEARLSGLESTVQSLNEQIASLGKDVESNRDNLIQNQLKKALLNIQEVGTLAKEETKASIAEVEKILSDLTSVANAPAPEPEAAADEPVAAEATQEPAAEAPAEAATPSEATPAEPVAPAETAPAAEPEASAPIQPETQAF